VGVAFAHQCFKKPFECKTVKAIWTVLRKKRLSFGVDLKILMIFECPTTLLKQSTYVPTIVKKWKFVNFTLPKEGKSVLCVKKDFDFNTLDGKGLLLTDYRLKVTL
jgi:hypothetical protein